jgi:hypothetical protein
MHKSYNVAAMAVNQLGQYTIHLNLVAVLALIVFNLNLIKIFIH